VIPEQRATNGLGFSSLLLPSLTFRISNVFTLWFLEDDFLDNNCNCTRLKPCRYYNLNPRNNFKYNISLSTPINQTPLHYISPQMSDLLENVSEI